jgi:hypothetical protein
MPLWAAILIALVGAVAVCALILGTLTKWRW